MTDKFSPQHLEIAERAIRVPLLAIDCCKFTAYDQPPDPAGLCDGGWYHHDMRIRVDHGGRMVFISTRRAEHEERVYRELPYDDFFDAIERLARRS